MNLVHKLLKAKGLTQRQLARELGVGYHTLVKTLTHASYKTKQGEIRFRECRHVREKFASWLGYPYELIWGPSADVFLRKLIDEEINRQAERQAELTRQQQRQALGI